jgi:hypothetical protein
MPTNHLFIKGEGEVIFPTYDITTLMKWGDTVSRVTSSIKVLQGEDDNAEALLYSEPTFVGNVVKQPIFFGVPGVTYEVTTHAETTGGDTIDVVWTLSIVPGPDISSITKGYSSVLFPVQIMDAITSVADFDKMWLLKLFPIEGIDAPIDLDSVALVTVVAYKTYSYTDAITPAFDLDSVSLIVVVAYKTYSYTEAITPEWWLDSIVLAASVAYITSTVGPEAITPTFDLDSIDLS